MDIHDGRRHDLQSHISDLHADGWRYTLVLEQCLEQSVYLWLKYYGDLGMTIEYTERSEGEYLWACMSLDDGTYIEVPIHGVLADDIQAKLQAALDVHNDMMAVMNSP